MPESAVWLPPAPLQCYHIELACCLMVNSATITKHSMTSVQNATSDIKGVHSFTDLMRMPIGR
jgi:hypothetical protein